MTSRRMRKYAAAVLCAYSQLLAPPLAAEPAVLELDHVYIVVQTPASAAVEALRKAGLTVDARVSRHAGQGTASMAAYFGNAYLELLWVDADVPVDPEHREALASFERAADWDESGASPFGIGLHFVSGTRADLAVPTRLEPASHLGPEHYYVLLRQPSEASAVDMFILPSPAALTQWVDRYRKRNPDVFVHPLGADRITRLRLHGTPSHRPQAASLAPRIVSFEFAESPLLELEFDEGLEGVVRDLRPALPLLLRR